MSSSRRLLYIVVSILAVSGVIAQERTPVAVSPPHELALGTKARIEFLETHLQSTDGNLAIRVDGIGRAIARVSDRPQLLYQFIVVQGEEPQAYSFPDGTIGLTEGLTWLFDTDDELAFAIAHEIAHVALRHHIAAFRLAQAADSEKSPRKLMLETVMGHFGAGQEIEADKYAALYAIRAGYKVSSATEALEKLAADSHSPDSDSDHPNYSRRISALAELRSEIDLVLKAFDEGTAALRAGDTDSAIGTLKYFVAEFPRNVSGRVNLGSAYLAKARQTAGTPQGLAEELPILPDHGIVVRGFYDRLDLEEARQQYREALLVEPEDVTALAGLALVEIRLDDLPEARRLMDAALLVEPDDPDLLLCSGNVDYLIDDYDAAMAQYVAALSLRPDWSPAKKNLALAHESLGQAGEARSLWQELVEDARYGPEARRRVRDLEGAPPSAEASPPES